MMSGPHWDDYPPDDPPQGGCPECGQPEDVCECVREPEEAE